MLSLNLIGFALMAGAWWAAEHKQRTLTGVLAGALLLVMVLLGGGEM